MPPQPRTPSKAEVGQLRRRMRALGATTDAIAAELARRYGMRPRQAYRLARGWDQAEAAAEYNDLVQRLGPEHTGRDSMTPSRVSEYERWPTSGRRPSPYVLRTFAELYPTTVERLLDHADLEALSADERAALTAPDTDRTAAGAALVVHSGISSMECERVVRRRRRDALVERVRAGGPEIDLEEFIVASADYARDGLTHLTAEITSTVGVLLASMLARAEARLGHPDAARESLHRAHAERDRVGDPADTGGLFACSVVGQACFAAGAHITLGDATAALTAADSAEDEYIQAVAIGGPPPYRSITMA